MLYVVDFYEIECAPIRKQKTKQCKRVKRQTCIVHTQSQIAVQARAVCIDSSLFW